MCAICPWFFIIFLYSHLVNLTFVLLTDPSFIPQLQFMCCSSTSFNSLFFLCLTLSSCPLFFFLRTFTILPPHRPQRHNVLGACGASGFQTHTSSRPICLLRQCLYTKYTCDCLLELSNTKLLASGSLSCTAVLKNLISEALFCLEGEEKNLTSSIV